MKGLSPLDPSSYSRPELAKVIKLNIELTVDFDQRIFNGVTTLTVKKIDPKAEEVVLDAHNLNITKIYESHLNKMLNYTIAEPIGKFGSKLTIELPPKDNDTYVVHVSYVTDNKATGLQWLEAEQTSGKELPYMFTQFEPIHARSLIPCQDTPGVKTPYCASITVPRGMNTVMAAPREYSKNVGNKTIFGFEQTVAVPSYLIAFAIGAIESRQIGPRSHVWAEKEILDAAAYEFEDTEQQLKTAEELCGPYVWNIYDILVLPPSFPFGGMENPCLTFVSPTLIAGDKSLATVVAHEIAHSWTGNLVTNRNFEHFWLNEGFTVFIERKILGRLKSANEQDFKAICGLNELEETIDRLGTSNPITSLVVDLGNIHPDDSFSLVPYEKGQLFLRYLEEVVGGPDKFEPFLRYYFDLYKYQSIDTDDFKNYFMTYFAFTSSTTSIDWDTWLYSPGMPPVLPTFNDTLHQGIRLLKKLWLGWDETSGQPPFTTADLTALSTNQLIQLLQEIMEDKPQPITKLQALSQIINLDSSKNVEIQFRWIRICIRAHWYEKIQPALDWINPIGRMKFVRPLYRDLYNWEEARPLAINNFMANRSKMMHVVSYTVSQDLHLDN